MELEEIRRRINDLAKEKEMMEHELKEATVNVIHEVAGEIHQGGMELYEEEDQGFEGDLEE